MRDSNLYLFLEQMLKLSATWLFQNLLQQKSKVKEGLPPPSFIKKLNSLHWMTLTFYLFNDVADAGVVEVVDRGPRDVLLQIVFLFLF